MAKRKGYRPRHDEELGDIHEPKTVNPYEFIWCDNVWQYVPDYGKNTRVRYLENRIIGGEGEGDEEVEIKREKALVLTMKMADYKNIIKQTHHERDLVKFICKIF